MAKVCTLENMTIQLSQTRHPSIYQLHCFPFYHQQELRHRSLLEHDGGIAGGGSAKPITMYLMSKMLAAVLIQDAIREPLLRMILAKKK